MFATAILPSRRGPTGSRPLNLSGAVLVWFWLGRTPSMMAHERETASPLATWAEHLRNAPLRRGFAIGF